VKESERKRVKKEEVEEKHLCNGCVKRSSQSVQIMNGDSVFS